VTMVYQQLGGLSDLGFEWEEKSGNGGGDGKLGKLGAVNTSWLESAKTKSGEEIRGEETSVRAGG